MESCVAKYYRSIRRLGFRHHLYDFQVWCISKLFPPPPKGAFPPVWLASRKPPYNLLARGGKLTPESLLLAYSNGIFPFCEKNPVDWYSCNPRMILFLEKMKLKKGLRPLLKSGNYRITFDTAYEKVVLGCSERQWTWLIPERIKVAVALHEKGHAHSVEAWNREGKLVGGVMGVAVGNVFVMESCFHRESNVGKLAMASLNCHLQHWGYRVSDIGGSQSHFRRFGYEEISRRRYLQILREARAERPPGKWSVDERLDVGNWIPAQPGSQLHSESTRTV